MTNRKRSPQEWQHIIEAQQASDLTIAEFCQQHALNPSTFYLQRKKITELSLPPSNSDWLPFANEMQRAQWRNILSGNNLAIDEVPMKAGRINTASRKSSKMKQTYFWPIYGEQDEVAFTWSKSRGMHHAMEQLQDFTGTLLTDGYSAYTSVVKTLNIQQHTIPHASCWAHLRRMFEQALDAAPPRHNGR